jgi:hypothetical protein
VNVRSRLREDDVGVGNGRTFVYTGISDKGGGVYTRRQTSSSIDDIDDGTVLVHFPVSDLVEPVPREDGFAGGSIGREGEGNGGTFDHTSTNDRVDDLPCLAKVVRHGELT